MSDLSGLLHGILALPDSSCTCRPANGETLVYLLGLVAAKLGLRTASPARYRRSVTTSGGPVVVDAHLYGTIGGVLGAAARPGSSVSAAGAI